MTSKTARANAAKKAKDAADREELTKKWLELMGSESPDREAYLRLGGTEAELTAFFWQYSS